MFQFCKKSDVVFTESHSVEIGGNYVGQINADKSGKFSFEASPHTGVYWRLTEDRLEKILVKVKELNSNV